MDKITIPESTAATLMNVAISAKRRFEESKDEEERLIRRIGELRTRIFADKSAYHEQVDFLASLDPERKWVEEIESACAAQRELYR